MTEILLTINDGNNGGNSISLNATDQNGGMDLYKVEALLEKHPDVQKTLGWNKDDIETFFEGSLLIGERRHEKGVDELYISENSLVRLIEYLESLKELKASFHDQDNDGEM